MEKGNRTIYLQKKVIRKISEALEKVKKKSEKAIEAISKIMDDY